MTKKEITGWVGVAVCILSVIVAIWLGLWVCIVGGVAAVINGFQADPWNGTQIGLGVLRFVSAGAVAWISIFVGWVSGVGIITISENM